MKTISLQIDDNLLLETEKMLSDQKTSRNRYINNAIAYYNQLQKKKQLEKQLCLESGLVQEESLHVLREFDNLDYPLKFSL